MPRRRLCPLALLAAACVGQPVSLSPALSPGARLNVSRASVFPLACSPYLVAEHGQCVSDCSAAFSLAVDAAGAFFSLTPQPTSSSCTCLAGGGEVAPGWLVASFPFGLFASGPRLSVNLTPTSCTTWTATEVEQETETFWYSSPPLECGAVYASASPAPCYTPALARPLLALPPVALSLTLRRTSVGPAYCTDAALSRSSALYRCTSRCSELMVLSKPADGGLFSLSPALASVDGCNCSGDAVGLLPPAGQPLEAVFRSGVTYVTESYSWGGGGYSDYATSSPSPGPAPGPRAPPAVYAYNSTLGALRVQFRAAGCAAFSATARPSGGWTRSLFACTSRYEAEAPLPDGLCLLVPAAGRGGGAARGGPGRGGGGMAVSLLALGMAVASLGIAGVLLLQRRRAARGGWGRAEWREGLMGGEAEMASVDAAEHHYKPPPQG